MNRRRFLRSIVAFTAAAVAGVRPLFSANAETAVSSPVQIDAGREAFVGLQSQLLAGIQRTELAWLNAVGIKADLQRAYLHESQRRGKRWRGRQRRPLTRQEMQLAILRAVREEVG